MNSGQIRTLNGLVIFPLDFPYLEAVFQGRPKHTNEMSDSFASRHPKMPRSKRAKQFAPFDALDGYNDGIRSKNVPYMERIWLDEPEKAEIGRRLEILHRLTFNRKAARKNHAVVTVRYYVPCTDENIFGYQMKGVYETVTGICRYVDADLSETIKVGEKVIGFSDILEIEAEDPKLFAWDECLP